MKIKFKFRYFIQIDKLVLTWKFSLALKHTPKACMDDYNQTSVIITVHNYFMNNKLTEKRNNPKLNAHESEAVGLKMQKHSYILV